MELYRNNNAELYDIMQEINLIYEDYTNIKKVELNLSSKPREKLL